MQLKFFWAQQIGERAPPECHSWFRAWIHPLHHFLFLLNLVARCWRREFTFGFELLRETFTTNKPLLHTYLDQVY